MHFLGRFYLRTKLETRNKTVDMRNEKRASPFNSNLPSTTTSGQPATADEDFSAQISAEDFSAQISAEKFCTENSAQLLCRKSATATASNNKQQHNNTTTTNKQTTMRSSPPAQHPRPTRRGISLSVAAISFVQRLFSSSASGLVSLTIFVSSHYIDRRA